MIDLFDAAKTFCFHESIQPGVAIFIAFTVTRLSLTIAEYNGL